MEKVDSTYCVFISVVTYFLEVVGRVYLSCTTQIGFRLNDRMSQILEHKLFLYAQESNSWNGNDA